MQNCPSCNEIDQVKSVKAILNGNYADQMSTSTGYEWNTETNTAEPVMIRTLGGGDKNMQRIKAQLRTWTTAMAFWTKEKRRYANTRFGIPIYLCLAAGLSSELVFHVPASLTIPIMGASLIGGGTFAIMQLRYLNKLTPDQQATLRSRLQGGYCFRCDEAFENED